MVTARAQCIRPLWTAYSCSVAACSYFNKYFSDWEVTSSKQEKAREKREYLTFKIDNFKSITEENLNHCKISYMLFECYVNLNADVFPRNKRIQGNEKFVHFGKLLTRFVRVASNNN